LRQPEVEKIDNTQIDFILTELYYYISKTEGINNAVNKLENFQQKINGNSLYFNNLKKLIKEDNANSMSILLY
jgi:K+/H+ antiporter YhaU regulatory subunit KhtT